LIDWWPLAFLWPLSKRDLPSVHARLTKGSRQGTPPGFWESFVPEAEREGIFGKKPPLNGDRTGPGNAQNSVQGAF